MTFMDFIKIQKTNDFQIIGLIFFKLFDSLVYQTFIGHLANKSDIYRTNSYNNSYLAPLLLPTFLNTLCSTRAVKSRNAVLGIEPISSR